VSLILGHLALSPFCRKVRMAMEYKGIEFTIAPTDHVSEAPAFNPRAEVPILLDGAIVVCDSPDILAYLDRRFPGRPIYPSEARAHARVREWERLADTQFDPIMTVIGTWKVAELPPMPPSLMEAARRDAARLYDQLETQLADARFVCGEISAADFALYPQVAAGAFLNLPLHARHENARAWLRRMRERPEGQTDLAAVQAWWANREQRSFDTRRVNWGTFRLEWLIANGGLEFFVDQVRQDKVLWSVGPNSNARNHPLAPAWLR
jgi:glutathione S-transferase